MTDYEIIEEFGLEHFVEDSSDFQGGIDSIHVLIM